jgi:competence protein ComEA
MTRKSIVASIVGATILAVASLVGQAQGQHPPSTNPPKAPAAAAKPVDLNTATTTELATLPGIGPATAARIVEYREKNGAFTKVEELMNIRGIGEKSFLKLKPLVVVKPLKVVK